MTRVAAALALLLGVALILGGSPEAEAKGSDSWIITGGALGEQAVHLVGSGDFGDDYVVLPGDGAARVDAPAVAPGEAYEFYVQLGVARVAEDVHAENPAFRFYPGSGLLHDRREFYGQESRWYQVSGDGAAARYVRLALSRMRDGDAHRDALVAAASVAGYYTRGGTTFRAVVAGRTDHSVLGTPGSLINDDALALATEIVEAVSVAPAGRSTLPEAMWIVLGSHSWSGPVAAYAPPDSSSGAPGRLWPGYITRDRVEANFYHTSPQFDALVQQSIERGEVHELERERSAEESLARIRAANAERMARVALEERAQQLALEERAQQLALVRAAEPPMPEPRAVEAARTGGARLVVGSLVGALVLATLAFATLARATLARSRR